ncbi:MAG: peptidase domain-containing ABC transporter [Magnetococcales bacterium]|nr:peptidase domain-containing ABC transporter [Magnetococcales bacterium]
MNAHLEATQYILETHILFSTLPDEDKRFLLSLFEAITLEPEQAVAEQGEPVQGFYYLYSGKVRIKENRQGKRISLGVMEKDASFGESSLLQDEVWPYSVAAEEKSLLFFLPAEKVRRMLATNPNMQQVFKQEIGLIFLSHRLRGMLGSARYQAREFVDILHHLGLKNIKAGRNAYQQGDEDPRLYYIELGEFDLVRTPVNGDPVVLERVAAGQVIGETALFAEPGREGRQGHTATAACDATVLVIPKAQVERIFAINPALQEKLRSHAKSLQGRERDELALRQRSEGVDQRIKLAQGVTEEEFLALEKGKEKGAPGRFPLVKQRDDSDSGAACITMIANHYGKKFSLGQVAELSNLSTAGATPNLIITAAETMGFRAKAYALPFEELDKIKLPAIIGWEGYRYAVLFQVDAKSVQLADPIKGLIKLSRQEFEQGWSQAHVAGVEQSPGTGVLIALDPTVKFTQLEPPKKPILHFLGYILPYKKYFMDALVGAFILNLLGLATPLFTQVIVDTVVVHKDVSLLNMMLGGMVLVAAFRTLTTVAQSMLLAHTTSRIDMKLMSEFYQHVLSLPMSFFLTRNKGEILARFGENAKIRAIIAGSSITVVLSSVMIFVYLFMMLGYNVFLTMVSVLFIPMYVGITLYFTPRIKAIANEVFFTNSRSQSFLIESLNGIESLKATANEYMARARWEEAFVENVNKGFQMQKLNLMSSSLNQLVNLGSTVAVLWIGANEVMANKLTVGELMGFQMLLGMVMGPVMQVVQLWNSSQDVRIAIDRVSDVLNVKPEQEPVTSPDRMPAVFSSEVQGRIDFEKVNFGYIANGQQNYVMKEFDLTIDPGQRVAFVGASGCGKSTIAKMVLGFNRAQGGLCAIDGKDISQIELGSLRRNIGVVLQDSFLFGGTVAENIALGDPEPDMAAVKEAARLAGADEFIVNYPLGYQTLVGEKGMGVSGGQRQRICIARALYRRPRILIFDEATSALDNESEARIQANMKDIMAGRTCITIAHRLTTIIDSDMICFIQDGKVAEKGSHKQLIDPDFLREKGYKGLYYALAEKQFKLEPLASLGL